MAPTGNNTGNAAGDQTDDRTTDHTDGRNGLGDVEFHDHPGRLRGKDEIDPELIKLRRPRIAGGPVLAVAIIFFCAYMIITLWADFRFSRQGDAPHEITSLAEITNGEVGAEDFVRLHARPDRGFALRLAEGLDSGGGGRLMPILGTDDKLWLLIGGEGWLERPAYSDSYTGRLRRLSDTPFRDNLSKHVKQQTDLPRFVDPKTLRSALEAKGSSLVGAHGDTLAVTDHTPVDITETVLDRARVRAFRREALPDAAAWTKALSDIGLAPHGGGPVSEAKEHLIYEVAAPNGLAGAKKALIEAKLFAARADALVRRHTSTWGALTASEDGLKLGDKTLPWENLTAVSLQVPRTVPGDALVVVTGDKPEDYWFMLPLYIVLGLFILLFGWSLIRTIRAARSDSGQASPSAEVAA